MIELFSLDRVQKTPGKFDRKKLAWMNGEYIRKATPDRLVDAFHSFNQVTDFPLKKATDAQLRELLAMYQERMATLAEMAENSRFFFEEPAYDAKAVDKHIKNNNGVDYLKQIHALLTPVTDWTAAGLAAPMEAMLAIGSAESGKRGAAAQPLRVALSGGPVSPPMTETVVLLGREKTLERIARFL